MYLKAKILKMINTPRIRIRLALALDCTDQTIIRYIKDNDDNLTKAAALQVLREELKLEDSKLLDDQPTAKAAG